MNFDVFENSKILITGASGLIGGTLVRLLAQRVKNVKIVAQVRNKAKAETLFNESERKKIEYLEGDVCEMPLPDMGVEYVIHAASMTASADFINRPVEVMKVAVEGTRRVMEFSRVNKIKSAAYLSSMEVYGAPQSEEKIYETAPTNLQTTTPRSAYPESKRLCECMCAAYHAEYNVPVKIVRLTQTFGEGVSYADKRVFAEFSRCVIEGRDIVLKTKGETKRNYLYTGDAATAILTVLTSGKDGEAYNAANEETYCSIYEMARLVADTFGNGKCTVKIEERDAASLGYAPTLRMNLSARKLNELGWEAKVGLKEMFARTIRSMKYGKETVEELCQKE